MATREIRRSGTLAAELRGMPELLTEATQFDICLIYSLAEDVLQLCAASSAYEEVVGRLRVGLSDGLPGWVARHGSWALIRDRAMDDPRVKQMPCLNGERFESVAAIPMLARSGAVIGVLVLHRDEPRDFGEEVTTLLSQAASLVAGIVEGAQLDEAARLHREALAALSTLGQRLAAASRREELYSVVTSGVRDLLACDVCGLYLMEMETGTLEFAAANPADHSDPDGTFVISAPVTAGDQQLGLLSANSETGFREDDDELLQTVANQLAVALKHIELNERLSATNVLRELFDALRGSSPAAASAAARAAHCDLSRPHVFLHVEPVERREHQVPWPERAERTADRLRELGFAVYCDCDVHAACAVLVLRSAADVGEVAGLDAELERIAAEEGVVIGRSGVRVVPAQAKRALREAEDAAKTAKAVARDGGALSYDSLGAYKYLVRLPLDDAPHDAHSDAAERLMAYDARRGSQLVDTLEEYLRRGRRVAATAKELYIHPNTLRQRLARIEQLSGLDLQEDDMLGVELALKLVRLKQAAGAYRPE